MRIYITSQNTGPTWTGPDPIHMNYIGPSIEEAIKAVGEMTRYARIWNPDHHQFPELYSVLPKDTPREMLHYYMADGWWATVVAVDF